MCTIKIREHLEFLIGHNLYLYDETSSKMYYIFLSNAFSKLHRVTTNQKLAIAILYSNICQESSKRHIQKNYKVYTIPYKKYVIVVRYR